MARPLRADVPIYLAALGPKNVALAAEIADGWLPIFFSPERFAEVFGRSSTARERASTSRRASRSSLLDDVQAARDALKPLLALYVGGMGSRGQNFYNDARSRATATRRRRERIQELYLDGQQRDAAAAVPDALVDEMALVGPRERIAERLDAWRESGVTTLLISTRDPATLRTIAEVGP